MFDKDSDLILKQWINEDSGLSLSIRKYKDGKPKLQIGPKFYTNASGVYTHRKARRLFKNDCEWLLSILPEILDALEKLDP